MPIVSVMRLEGARVRRITTTSRSTAISNKTSAATNKILGRFIAGGATNACARSESEFVLRGAGAGGGAEAMGGTGLVADDAINADLLWFVIDMAGKPEPEFEGARTRARRDAPFVTGVAG